MKDEIINIIKEAMGENYKKVLWIFQEYIKNLINCYNRKVFYAFCRSYIIIF